MKTCTKCQTDKLPESFYKDGTSLRTECKVCTLAARAKFYVGNKEGILSRSKTNYAKSGLVKRHAAERGEPGMPTQKCGKCEKEKPVSAFLKKNRVDCRKCLGNAYVRDQKKRRKSIAKYVSTHREQLRTRSNNYRASNLQKVKASEKIRRPKIRVRERLYYAKHPEKRAVRNATYHHRMRAAPGKITAANIKARFDFYGNKCAYCGGPAEAADHVIAVVRGGSNWPANIRPSCTSCNSSKGDKSLAVWKAEKFAA